MGYIEKNLVVDENIFYQTKLHWIVFVAPTILCTLAIPILISGSFLGGFLLFVGVIFLIIRLLSFKNSEFAVTNKRVLIKIGFIKVDSLETFLSKIEGIQVTQGIGGRIFNYGTIIVKGVGGTSNPFCKIKNPLEFRMKVQEQIEKNVGITK